MVVFLCMYWSIKATVLGLGCCISWKVSVNNHYARAHGLVFRLCVLILPLPLSCCKPLGKLLNMAKSVFSAVNGEK